MRSVDKASVLTFSTFQSIRTSILKQDRAFVAGTLECVCAGNWDAARHGIHTLHVVRIALSLLHHANTSARYGGKELTRWFSYYIGRVVASSMMYIQYVQDLNMYGDLSARRGRH